MTFAAVCPKCGSDYREARQCPQYDGQPVCIRCCRECSYYEYGAAGMLCRYHLIHQKTNYTQELRKIDQQIEYAQQRVRRLYEINWPQKAARMELEVSALLRKKRELERKRKNEELKKTGAAL